MNRKKRIKNILLKNFINYEVNVIDNSFEHIGHNNFDGSQESHFLIQLKGKFSESLSTLEIHRNINILLNDEFDKGLHALEIKIVKLT